MLPRVPAFAGTRGRRERCRGWLSGAAAKAGPLPPPRARHAGLVRASTFPQTHKPMLLRHHGPRPAPGWRMGEAARRLLRRFCGSRALRRARYGHGSGLRRSTGTEIWNVATGGVHAGALCSSPCVPAFAGTQANGAVARPPGRATRPDVLTWARAPSASGGLPCADRLRPWRRPAPVRRRAGARSCRAGRGSARGRGSAW